MPKNKLTLTEDDRHAIVNALLDKARGDTESADEIERENGGPKQTEVIKRLVFTLRNQAENGRRLARTIETFDVIELRAEEG